MRLATTSNLSLDTSGVEWATIFVVIVAAVALHDGWFGQWPAPPAANWRDRFDERQQLRDVVPIRAGQNQRERDTTVQHG